MRGDYTLAEWKVEDSIAMIQHWKRGTQLWTEIKTRKIHRCCVTGKLIEKGFYAFRPITNSDNRMDRISHEGIMRLCLRAGRSKDV